MLDSYSSFLAGCPNSVEECEDPDLIGAEVSAMDIDLMISSLTWDAERESSSFGSESFSSEMIQSSLACNDGDDDLDTMMESLLGLDNSLPQCAFFSEQEHRQPETAIEEPFSLPSPPISHHQQQNPGILDQNVNFVFQEKLRDYDERDVDSVRLVHLLLGGAEAIVCGETDLANAILNRLKSCSTQSGTTMQRIAAYFSDALHCRLYGIKCFGSTESYFDTVGAFHVLHEICPYVKFGHFSANQAILEAVAGATRVHIVDFDIMDGVQWPSLMQALALRAGGPPHLRITSLYRPNSKGALSTTQETGKRLAACARQFNVTFAFNQVRVDGDSEEFRSSSLRLVQGETLVVNCMLHLPHMPYHSENAVRFFLGTMMNLRPEILTVVEEELSCTSTTFTGRFYEALYHYSTLFDSLEATLASEKAMRSLVERVFLGPRIKSTVTSAVTSRISIEEEVVDHVTFHLKAVKNRWSSLAAAAGFRQRSFSSYNLCQARLLAGL